MMNSELGTIVAALLASYHLEPRANRTRQDIIRYGYEMLPPVRFFIEVDEIYLQSVKLRSLSQGPIASIPINKIVSKIREILDHAFSHSISQFPLIRASETDLKGVMPQICDLITAALYNFLSNSRIKRFLFPLTAISLRNALEFKRFSLHTSESFEELSVSVLGQNEHLEFINTIRSSATWLEIKSPNEFHANSLKRLVLGSLALASLDLYRYQENIVAPAKNYFVINGSLSMSSSGYHTPSLATQIEIQNTDYDWLSTIDSLIENHLDHSSAKALKYFYRAWFESDHDRMATLFACIDVFSNGISVLTSNNSECETNKIAAKKPFIEAIRADANLNEVRLGLLYKIRSDISHGRSPNIYESKNYLTYVKTYKFEPLADLEAIADLMLRKRAFENKIPTRSDPYAALISAAQQQGILPTEQSNRSILFDLSE